MIHRHDHKLHAQTQSSSPSFNTHFSNRDGHWSKIPTRCLSFISRLYPSSYCLYNYLIKNEIPKYISGLWQFLRNLWLHIYACVTGSYLLLRGALRMSGSAMFFYWFCLQQQKSLFTNVIRIHSTNLMPHIFLLNQNLFGAERPANQNF